MGMFDKDKEFGNRLDSAFQLGTPFILHGAKMTDRTIETRFGDAPVAELLVQRLGADSMPDGPEFTCSTVATAIVEKVKAADDGDFPAVVELRQEHSAKWRTTALVLQFVAPYSLSYAGRQDAP